MKKSKTRKQSLKGLIKKADGLYQLHYIPLKPFSVVSGLPTEVIHHFILKSQSNALRYDDKNGVPLINSEHTRHHLSGDPYIVKTIVEKMGEAWFDDLQRRRRVLVKMNREYLLEIIRGLEV